MCSTFLGCGVLRLFVLLHTAAVRALLLCFAAVYWLLSRLLLWGSLPWLPHCWWPSSAVLLVLVPPLARSVFGPGPNIPVRAGYSWPRPGSAGPSVRSVRRSQCRRPGAGFGVGLWCRGAYWRPRLDTNRGLQLRHMSVTLNMPSCGFFFVIYTLVCICIRENMRRCTRAHRTTTNMLARRVEVEEQPGQLARSFLPTQLSGTNMI